MINVTATDEKFTPFYLNGRWLTLITFATSRGFLVYKKSNYTQLSFSDWRYLTLDYYLLAAEDGYTITNYPVYLSLEPTLYNTEVPVGIPNRTTVTFNDNNEEVIVVKKWSEWGSSEHIDLTNNTKGIPLVTSYTALTNVEVANLNGITGYTLMDSDTYKQYIPIINDI